RHPPSGHGQQDAGAARRTSRAAQPQSAGDRRAHHLRSDRVDDDRAQRRRGGRCPCGAGLTMLAEATAAETRSYIGTPDRLGDIDSWIEQAGKNWRLPEDVVFRARVCVAEILANLLEHGRSNPDGDDIRITLRPVAPALDLEISDSGRPFDPTGRAAAAAAAPI